jgi:hypothetical protein
MRETLSGKLLDGGVQRVHGPSVPRPHPKGKAPEGKHRGFLERRDGFLLLTIRPSDAEFLAQPHLPDCAFFTTRRRKGGSRAEASTWVSHFYI